MNSHQSDSQNKTSLETRPPFPLSVDQTEIPDVVPQHATDTEMRKVFRQIHSNGSMFGIAPMLRYLFSYEKVGAVQPASLLQMELEEVLAILSEERKIRAHWKYMNNFLGWHLSFMIPFFVFLLHLKGPTFQIWSIPMVIPLSLLFSRNMASQKHQAAAAMLSRFDDVRAVGPLAETLEFQDKSVTPYATSALIRLLPHLKASDSLLLDAYQRSCLNRALRGKNTELTLAILKAWEQIGDAAAIPAVERLAKSREQDGRRPEVVTAAKECLSFLKQSTERRQSDQELLRPADGNKPPSDMLLRPAAPQASADPPDQLLRPTDDA